MQRLLRDAAVRYEELEMRSRTEIDQLKEEAERNVICIDEMKKELDRANTLLEAAKSRVLSEECIEAMSPSVAAASRYEQNCRASWLTGLISVLASAGY
jgi:hypothetical protein